MLVMWFNEGQFWLLCLLATLPSAKYSKTVRWIAQKCAPNIQRICYIVVRQEGQIFIVPYTLVYDQSFGTPT